ncbi:MAG: hypothetical protein IH819_08770 [Bacteroidetes bacterium]|nr:hypothetical protein [Bacteroidota bacterium]
MTFQILKILTLSSYLLIALLLTFCSNNEKVDATENIPSGKTEEVKISITDQKIFGIQSGIIEYEVTGSQTGNKKLYFTDWGRKQAEFSNSTIKVGKFSKHSNLLKITNGDWQYIINLEKKTGTKRENPVLRKMYELSNQINYNDFGEQLVLIEGGVKTGMEVVAGKNCTIYNFRNKKSKSWIWNWITLKSESLSGGVHITVTAKNIKENVSVPDSVFNPPKNILIIEVDLEDLRNQEVEIGN